MVERAAESVSSWFADASGLEHRKVAAIAFEEVLPAPEDGVSQAARVRMRDGVHLATDIYLPDGPVEPGPTVLIRLPYDKNSDYMRMREAAEYVTSRGYRMVVQDVRGKFRSEGEPVAWVNEANDGADTLDWVIQQPWSDGLVGMAGDSYYGYTQWAAASTSHPALRAISPRFTGTDLNALPSDEGDRREVEVSFGLMYDLTIFMSRNSINWRPDWETLPLSAQFEAVQEAVGARSTTFDMHYPHRVPIRRFPNGSPFEQRAIPVLHTIGWWDNCATWSWTDQHRMQESAAWAAANHLLIEPSDHENIFLRPGGVAEPASMAEVYEPTLAFFDVYLRNLARPESIPRVRWSLAGTDEYRETVAWPPPGATPAVRHLTADRALAPEQGSDETLSWVHDPEDCVPSSAKDPFAFLGERPDDQALAQRADVLAFAEAARSEAVELVGPVTFEALVSSDAPAFDVFVRLYDRAPDGRLDRIALGQISVPRADGLESIEIELGHLGYLLRAGHSLQLHVQSSDYPEFLRQPGTGEEAWSATTTRSSTQTIRLGGGSGVLRFAELDHPTPS
ncbi:CocE/NonD family hydrolase [Microbacterium sp. Root180]|uniref:CocE/NonD family hydrolase n=1 Tax=Microbacterium sp. Root180 TaxID=1736483 RepID=UPI0006FE03B5|nr:CocE/NonD family hydrolase [Microbacterium sp. Root180]KRB37211.1 hypothetical protein ASD93_14630 [Microbacterium sp. Root180]